MRPLAILLTLLFASTMSGISTSPCHPPPHPRIDWLGTQSGCSRNTVPCVTAEVINFSVTPTNGSFAACDSFDWDFGDGVHSSLKNPTHSFVSTGTASIFLKVFNATGPDQFDGDALTVVAATVSPSIDYFRVLNGTGQSVSNVTPGQPIVFSWSTKNATRGIRVEYRHPPSVQTVILWSDQHAAGTTTPFIQRDTTVYTLTALGDASTQTQTIIVEVVGSAKRRSARH